MKGIELYCGSGKMSETIKASALSCFSFDSRSRKGVCTPDFRVNIMNLSPKKVFHCVGSRKIDFAFVGLPCTIWSHASGNFHIDENFNPKTEFGFNMLALTNHTLQLLEGLKCSRYFIENPRGRLRYYKPMTDFLVRNNGMIKEFTMSSFGFSSQKPTNIYTNAHDLTFPPLDAYGRGAKAHRSLNNLTTCQRQAYPLEFCEHITNYLLSKLK